MRPATRAYPSWCRRARPGSASSARRARGRRYPTCGCRPSPTRRSSPRQPNAPSPAARSRCIFALGAMIDDDANDEADEAARARPSFIGAQLEAQAKAAAQKGDWRKVATVTLEAYGDEILGFLIAQAKDDVAANEAFSMFTEAMWRGLVGFRWECT